MSIVITTPITGAAQSGFTSPTYTLIADFAPGNDGRQQAVSGIGGTQAGVTVHSVAAPFTLTVTKPKVLKTLQPVNPVTGKLGTVQNNIYKFKTRKGVLPLAGQAYVICDITTIMTIPAGSDLADSANIRAAISAHIGALSQQSAGVGDTATSGII